MCVCVCAMEPTVATNDVPVRTMRAGHLMRHDGRTCDVLLLLVLFVLSVLFVVLLHLLLLLLLDTVSFTINARSSFGCRKLVRLFIYWLMNSMRRRRPFFLSLSLSFSQKYLFLFIFFFFPTPTGRRRLAAGVITLGLERIFTQILPGFTDSVRWVLEFTSCVSRWFRNGCNHWPWDLSGSRLYFITWFCEGFTGFWVGHVIRHARPTMTLTINIRNENRRDIE